MTFVEFRHKEQHSLCLDKVTIEFINLPHGETILVTSLNRTNKRKIDINTMHSRLGTQCIGAYEAFEIFKQLKS